MAFIRARTWKNGRVVYTVRWNDPDSHLSEDSLQFDTEPEAEAFKRIIEANGGRLALAEKVIEQATVDGPTLAEAVQTHIDHITGATAYTVKRYRDYLRLHIEKSPIGARKIKGLRGNDLRAWIVWMEKRGKKPKTVSNVFGLISSTLIGAAREGFIPANPCAGVRLPKRDVAGDDGEMTNEDFHKIRDAIDPHFQPFLDFLRGSGVRYSEATALLADDFKLDVAIPIVRIIKVWKQNDDGTWYIGPPKTAKGKRTISLAPSTVAAVRPLVETAGAGTVFRMKRGGVMTPQAFYNRAWQASRRAVGLEDKVTVHSIRHLHAAIMLGAGMDMYELSRRMGHESVQMTVELYSHLLPDAHFRGAEVAQKALEL
ncbi:tyrosine-type recombinase/integrase [Sinomonas susongensis]|uniref:tyrosine-type recombinase/integrase n=1 Tax=Sinomonas susongensis TaxID=1324851 RepID=UPI00110A000E|nr:site-specific integrase [Sinomonas susongensis]